MKNYLVFESTEEMTFTGGGYVTDPRGNIIQRDEGRMIKGPFDPYVCIGAVKAADVDAAAQATVRATRRVSKFAFVEASFVDFTKDEDDTEPDANRPVLNP